MRTEGLFLATVVVGFSLAIGCGSSVSKDPNANGGAGGSGGSGGSGASGGSGGSGAGGACAAYADATSPGTTTVRFHNEAGVPIYLPSMCDTPSFTIEPDSGPDGNTYVYETSCLQTCQDLQTQDQYACGACAPSSYLIPPGGTLEVPWDRRGLRNQVQMPAACWHSTQGSQTCSQFVAAPAGTYQVQAIGYATCNGFDGACQCDAGGHCNGDASGQEAYADWITFQSSDGAVDVVFGVCAFPCPGGS